MLPFVHFGFDIIESDTQPFYFLLILLSILIYNYKYVLFTFERTLLFLALIVSIISFFYGFDTKKSFNLIILLIALIYFSRNTFDFSLIRFVLIIYSIFFIAWILFPYETYLLQSSLVRNINTGPNIESSIRGYPILSTEPGLYAGTAVMLMELYILKLKKWHLFDYLILAVISISIVFTYSGSSIIFLSVFLILRIKNIKSFFSVIVLFILFNYFLVDYLPENRLTYFINSLNSEGFDFLSKDSSLSYRTSSILLSIDFFLSNFFGAIGVENLSFELQKIYLNKFYNPNIGMTFAFHLVSGFGYALVCGGIFSFLFFLAVIFNYKSLRGILYFSLCILFSYSLIYPVSSIVLIEFFKNKNNVWNTRKSD